MARIKLATWLVGSGIALCLHPPAAAQDVQTASAESPAYAITARGFNSVETPNELLVPMDGRSIYSTLALSVFWELHKRMVEDIQQIGAAGTPAGAQATEEAVQAAFLPKFARYVQWPGTSQPGPRQPFVLCIIGRDPFGPQLDRAAASESIDGRPVTVRRLASPDDAGSCHVAFVRGPTPQDTARWLLALRAVPVLTVTDSRNGPQRGIIHFSVATGRVRFFIDDAEAAERGLTISSRLLALALGVRQRR